MVPADHHMIRRSSAARSPASYRAPTRPGRQAGRLRRDVQGTTRRIGSASPSDRAGAFRSTRSTPARDVLALVDHDPARCSAAPLAARCGWPRTRAAWRSRSTCPTRSSAMNAGAGGARRSRRCVDRLPAGARSLAGDRSARAARGAAGRGLVVQAFPAYPQTSVQARSSALMGNPDDDTRRASAADRGAVTAATSSPHGASAHACEYATERLTRGSRVSSPACRRGAHVQAGCADRGRASSAIGMTPSRRPHADAAQRDDAAGITVTNAIAGTRVLDAAA